MTQNPYEQQPPYGQPNPYGAPTGQPGGYPAPGGGAFYVSVLGHEQGPLSAGQLSQMALGGQLKGETMIRTDQNQNWFPAKQVPGVFSDKDWTTTLILSILIGGLGVDRFYLGYTGLGVAKLLTLGGCGIWSIIDIILIAMRKLPDAQGRPLA